MAVYEHGITEADIVADFPSAEPEPFGSKGEHGVTSPMIATWITRYAARANTLLVGVNGSTFDPSADLGEDDAEDTKHAIVSAVVARALFKLRRYDAAAQFQSDWDTWYRQWSEASDEKAGDGSAFYTRLDSSDVDDLVWNKTHQW